MPEKVGVFVSHHHSPEEDTFTARLVADLRAAGADVWVDNDEIRSGSFIQKINQGLADKDWFVLVMTPEALGSTWVMSELEAGFVRVNLGYMRSIIPIVAKPCGEVPPLLEPFQRYDATNDYETARVGLFRALGLVPRVTMTPEESAAQPQQPAPQPPAHQRPLLRTILTPDNIRQTLALARVSATEADGLYQALAGSAAELQEDVENKWKRETHGRRANYAFQASYQDIVVALCMALWKNKGQFTALEDTDSGAVIQAIVGTLNIFKATITLNFSDHSQLEQGKTSWTAYGETYGLFSRGQLEKWLTDVYTIAGHYLQNMYKGHVLSSSFSM